MMDRMQVKMEAENIENVKKDLKHVKEMIMDTKGTMQCLKGALEDVQMRNKLGKRNTIMAKIEKVESNIDGNRVEIHVRLVKEEYDEVKKRKMDEKLRKVVELVDQVKEYIEEFLKPMEELADKMEAVLELVHGPASLVDLAAGRVLEEGMELEELPTTLKAKVMGLHSEKQDKAVKELTTINAITEEGDLMVDEAYSFYKTKVLETKDQIVNILQ